MFVALMVGLVAAGSALLLNLLILGRIGSWAAPVLGALVEEALKTGLAVSFGANIVLTHAVFGALESLLELYLTGQSQPYRPRWFLAHPVRISLKKEQEPLENTDSGVSAARRSGAALVAFFGHTIYGLVASLAYNRTGFLSALAVGALLHLTWNLGVLTSRNSR